jgi:uncharacterized membrane protein
MSKSLKSLVVLLYIVSIGLVTYGIVTMYYYPDSYAELDAIMERTPFNHLVEGDAYNYIIMAGRGIGLILIGGFIGLIANIINIYGLISARKEAEYESQNEPIERQL